MPVGKRGIIEADSFAGQQAVILILEIEQKAHVPGQAVAARRIYWGGVAAELVDIDADLIGQFEFATQQWNEFIRPCTALQVGGQVLREADCGGASRFDLAPQIFAGLCIWFGVLRHSLIPSMVRSYSHRI